MTGVIATIPRIQFSGPLGVPLIGGKLYTYLAGTTTPEPTFQDEALTIANTNPVVLDGTGSCTLWLDPAKKYKFLLKNALGITQPGWPVDDISGASSMVSLAPTLALYAKSSALAAATGAGLIGFDDDTPYPANTVGDVLGKLVSIRNIRTFGKFVGNGIADDSAVWAAAAASGPGVIDARGVTSRCLSTVNVGSGQTWLLQGANLFFEGSTTRLFSCVTVNDWNLVGPFKINGDLVTNPGEGVTAAGVYIKDCLRWHVAKPTGVNIRGSVVELVPGDSTAARGEHGTVDSPVGKDCVWGWKDTAGSGAEYCTVINPRFTGMVAAGIQTQAGNTLFLGGQVLDNFDGVRLQGGPNNCHGSFVGVNINHNSNYDIFADGVTNGESFANCHIYGNNAVGGGAVYLKNSKKIVFDGGTLDAWVYNDSGAGSGLNYIKNMYCPGDYGEVKILSTNSGTGELVVTDCFGPGAVHDGISINTPAVVYTELERQPGVVQAITSATPTALLWPSIGSDKRGVYSGGVFTVPAGEGGRYRVRGNQLFEGSTINAAASYIEVQTQSGGSWVSKDLELPRAIFGASLIQIEHDSVLTLKAGDKVRLMANITGTGVINHGRATWRSWVVLEKIA